ncbi:MAG: hypothetical protein R3338_15255, partial [Thermoanaerobaculia bacterium]|nr:hypothetical protein [Thermoanaerobaculia bacterium]
MPEQGPDRYTGNGRKVWLVAWIALGFVVVECAAMVMMVRGIGLALPIGRQGIAFILRQAPAILVALAVHAAYHFFRGRGKEYLRKVASLRWLSLTLVLFSTLVVLMIFYAGLKV